jgi:hypothetical protein
MDTATAMFHFKKEAATNYWQLQKGKLVVVHPHPESHASSPLHAYVLHGSANPPCLLGHPSQKHVPLPAACATDGLPMITAMKSKLLPTTASKPDAILEQAIASPQEKWVNPNRSQRVSL